MAQGKISALLQQQLRIKEKVSVLVGFSNGVSTEQIKQIEEAVGAPVSWLKDGESFTILTLDKETASKVEALTFVTIMTWDQPVTLIDG